MKVVALVLALMAITATAVVATHPEVLQNLAITPCSRYVLVSAHAGHPQRDNPGGVIGNIGYGFSYRPWGTVRYVKVLPNVGDVREVVFVLNKTGLMQYFKLFPSSWGGNEITLAVVINDRAIAIVGASLRPDGTITKFNSPNVWVSGNEVHVKVFGWSREPCDLKIQLSPNMQFGPSAPVRVISLPGAAAHLKCAACAVNLPTGTETAIPNARIQAVAITSVIPWDPKTGEEFTVNYYVYLNYAPEVPFHATVMLALNTKNNVVRAVSITIPAGQEIYEGSFTMRLNTVGTYYLYVGVKAYGQTVWSPRHGVLVRGIGATVTGAPALPTSTSVSEPTFTLPVVTSTPTTTPTMPTFTHTTATYSNTQPSTHTPAHRGVLDQIRSAIQSLVDRIREWFSGFRWPQ